MGPVEPVAVPAGSLPQLPLPLPLASPLSPACYPGRVSRVLLGMWEPTVLGGFLSGAVPPLSWDT